MTRSIFVIIITVCITMFTSVAFAQENAPNGGTVRGIILDTTPERNPIEGVTVNIVGTDNKVFTVKTDAKGQYKCDNLPAGRYLINISKQEYVDRVGRAVTIVDGGDHFVQIRMHKRENAVHVIDRPLGYIIGNIGERYKLEESSMGALYQSLLEVLIGLELGNLEAKLQENNLMGAIALLSHPDSKAAFAKHLTETQLDNYIEFIENRQQRAWQTVAHFLTAFLDQTLSLNSKQREDVLKLLLDTIAHSPKLDLDSMFSSPNLQREVVDFLHYELKISLQTILTPTQAKIWNGLIKLKNAKRDLVGESELSELIDATLTAHIEQQLGTLGEQENRRLQVAIKGVIQQAIEAQKPDIEEKINYIDASFTLLDGFIRQDVPREQAAEQLELLKKRFADEMVMSKRWRGSELPDLTSHSLYQRTIKAVLSEEAYRQYTERQTERKVFQTQTSQALLVTSLDAVLLLKETHRKQLETTAAQVTLLSLSAEGLHMIATEMLITMNPEILSLLRLYND